MNSSFDKRKKYSNKEINMINKYEKLNMMVKEDISWSEYACCYEYANQVIDYT